jgi:putative ABC transport system permease protein
MSLWRLAKQSLGFYWRTNLGVLLTVVVSTAILTGALVVGDSVRYSLRMMVKARLGSTQIALVPQNRFFTAGLANELADELNTSAAPVLRVRGLMADGNDKRRANRIEVLGVDASFFTIGAAQNPFGNDKDQGIVLNEQLATRLKVASGDEVLLRIENPSVMSRDLPVSPDSDLSVAFRLKVVAIATEAEFGRFSLHANQVSPLNAFVPLDWIQTKLKRDGQANMLLLAEGTEADISPEIANEAIQKRWQLADAELKLRKLEKQDALEIRSRRIFIDESLSEAAMRASDKAVGILTYFVNELRVARASRPRNAGRMPATQATPYSMVTAMGRSTDPNGIVPMEMQDDEILINQWLADDLDAKTGDLIELRYFTMTPMRKLQEQAASFHIRQIIPMTSPAVDPDLMPDFPGLADVNNCRDWDSSIPINLDKIRQKDEEYWDKYRGAPKAFITLEAGQKMWANRYGNLTAVRYRAGTISVASLAQSLLKTVNPASVGLFFQPVRQSGIKAGGGSTDFGSLFLGLSMFLIIAALILTSLIFVFGVEKRSGQIGMLLAVGFSKKQVRRLLLIESGALAIIGAIVGSVAALLYTRIMIYGLATAWQSAVSGSTIRFYAKPTTLFAGAFGAVVVCLITIWLTLRRQVSRPARELLAGNPEWQFFGSKRFSKGRIGLVIAITAVIGAVVLLAVLGKGDSSSVSAAFFGAGALLLIAGLGLTHALLKIVAGRWNRTIVTLAGLGLRNSTRRSGRSLAVVGLLACGIFLVIAVGANRQNPLADAHKQDSGTGGFTLFGQSSIGILHDLGSKSGRRSMGLNDSSLDDIQAVQLRVRDGDDASCFNLNRAQSPQLLGVQPAQLQKRGSFTFVSRASGPRIAGKMPATEATKEAWNLLNRNLGPDVVPAVGDYPTVIWALGKSVGDQLQYSDDKGNSFKLQIVGLLKNSILQGSLIIAEDEFIKRFPSEEGYRMLLIDCPQQKIDAVTDKLSFGLKDFGLDLMPAAQRLAEFNAVENTYLSIFQLLGGFGLILGSVGLGLVVLRNVLDRRGELAMLRAVGFDKITLRKMIFHEHSGLMLGGLACGVIAALVAVGPALKSPGVQAASLSLILTIVAIGISGMIWIWLATKLALSGEMLDALRNE